MKVREKIIFYGRVQAVGFRYRSQQFATALGLTGSVKNLSNGSVEMEVEGDEETIAEFVDKLCHSPYIKVNSLDSTSLTLKNDEKFRILDGM